MDDNQPDQRQQRSSAWFRRSDGLLRNPIFQVVIGGILLNVLWAGILWATSYAAAKTHEYWRSYGAGIAAEAQSTNNPDKLRAIVARVQAARAPE